MRDPVAIGALAVSLIFSSALPQSALAQSLGADDAAIEGQGGIKDIVVTARKRAENLQDVPAAISALGAEQLTDLQISGFQDVGRTVPNVVIRRQSGSPTTPQFYIRGISMGSINFQIDSGIALYVDGVYLGRPGNSGFDLADLERLEVARGPQGTLFGRNSTGGAVSFITSAPTGELGVIAEGTLGNFQRRRGRLTINTPEWNGFSARLTYVHDENTGSVKNSAPRRTFLYPEPFGTKKAAASFGANNSDSILAAVRYRNGGLTVDYKFDYTDLVTTIDAMQLLNAGESFTATAKFPDQTALGGTNVVGVKRRSKLPIDGIAPSTQKTWGHSLTANYEINDNLSVKYIGAVRGFTVNTTSELDGNVLVDPKGSGRPYQILAALRYGHQRQWSHELQLQGHSDRVDWVVGLFSFRERAELDSPTIFGQVTTPGQPIEISNPGSYLGGGAIQKYLNKSRAVYGHATFRPVTGVELGGGLRYSHDIRTEDDLLAVPRTPPRGAYTAKQGRWDYDVSAKVEVSDNANVYGKFATGHVSGGIFNSVEFKPETVRSFEVGLKSEWFNRHLRVDIALFDAKRKNSQVAGFVVGPGNILTNSGGDRSRGVEIETTLMPVEGLTLTANYGFTDMKTTSGVRPSMPRHTAYLAAQYEQPVGNSDMKVRFRLDGQYISKQYRLRCPIGATASEITGCSNLQDADYALDKALIMDAQWDLGARATLADIPLGTAKASVSVWGKNLTNNNKFEYLFQVLPKQILGTFQTPRTYGIDFRVEY